MNLVTFLNREGDMRFAQDICEEWQTRVKQSYYKNKAENVKDDNVVPYSEYTFFQSVLPLSSLTFSALFL